MRAAALLVAVLATGCTTPGGAPQAAPPVGAPAAAAAAPAVAPGPPAAPEGFRVSVEHSTTPAGGAGADGPVSWESHWVLEWEPVPGAEEYAVFAGTSEGAASEPQRTTDEPRLRVQAAAGTSTPERLEQDRAAGLLFTSSQLLVSVAARVGGQEGPRSPWYPVGDAPADGVPVPTGVEAGGHGGH